MARRVLVVLAFILILVGALVYSQARHEPRKVSGFIEAHEVRVGSRVGGRVAAVRVAEGDAVTSGAILIELEAHDLTARREQAAAALDARRANLAKLEAGFRAEEIAQAQGRRDQLAAQLAELEAGPRKQEIAVARARVESARATVTLAEREHARIEKLHASAVTSQEELDRAAEALNVARATQRANEESLGLLEAGTRPEQIEQGRAALAQAEGALALMKNGNRAEDIAAGRSAVAEAEGTLAAIDRDLAELAVRAPLDGRIEALDIRPGDLVAPGAPVLSIMDVSTMWVRAYVPEDELGVKLNEEFPVKVDSFPERRFRAKVTFVSRQAEFTPSNVQTPEDRSRQVFRIKATLEEGLDVLRPGMAADLWLEEPAR